MSRQPCVVCGRTPADPHHLRFAQPRAFGRKVSDGYTGPVAHIIANCMAMATRHRRGRELTSIPIRSRSGYGKERALTGGWNPRPGTRGQSSSLVQSGQAIHRILRGALNGRD